MDPSPQSVAVLPSFVTRKIALSLLSIVTLVASGPSLRARNESEWQNASLGDWSIASNWTFGVPDSNTYAVVANGGTALVSQYDRVALIVDLGKNGQNGNMIIQGGLQCDQGMWLGIQSGSAGTLTVNGLLYSSYLAVGGYSYPASGNGTLNIQNGFVSTWEKAWVGGGGNSTGSATVTGSSAYWGCYESLDIGVNSGSVGTLTVSNGGELLTAIHNQYGDALESINSTIGTYPGSQGTVTVTGSGSYWQNYGNLFVGGRGDNLNNFSANGGSGVLRIQAGGYVGAANLKFFNNGLLEVSNGSSTVAGLGIFGGAPPPPPGGTLGDLAVGNTTSGRMEIARGGTLWTNRGFMDCTGGGSAFALVTGTGSKWTATGSIWAGNAGIGTLEVRSGGVVTSAGNGYLGFSSGSFGTAVVSGAGSSWTTTSNLFIGGNGGGPGGQGLLMIENGAVVTTAATTVYGGGFLQLGNNPTLNGPLTFLGGHLQTYTDLDFAKDFTLGSGGVIVNTIGRNPTFSGILSGSGGLSLFFLGTQGALTLSGDSTYTGPTQIPKGTLIVNGSITSDVTVSGTGTLAGSGSVGSVTVNNGGAVAPGNSPGKLTVNGNYTQTSGGILNMEIGGNAPGDGYDQLDVSGLASIDGTLNLTLVNGFAPEAGDTFTILASGGETGNFSTITANGLTVTSDSNGGGIVLTVTAVSPDLISAVSRKGHGIETFDIDLPLRGPPGVECRTGGAGGNHQVVLTFADVVTVAGVSLTSDDGLATAQESVNGSEVTVDLSNVANAQVLGITLNAVSDGVNVVDIYVPMGVLVGDTTGNGTVNASDVSQTKAQIGQAVTGSNFRTDVNANGTINASDVALVKSQVGTAIPTAQGTKLVRDSDRDLKPAW